MSALVFGKYAVLRRLAVGGMGEIHLARLAGTEERVILKSLLPALAEQPSSVEQFLDEARVLAQLSHPNLVSVYEVGRWEGTYYIAMELIDGPDLGSLMKSARERREAIPLDVAARVLRDAARGLDHAHRAVGADGRPLRVVHRDVSPSNVMLTRAGTTKVVDFGIARAEHVDSRTATGMIRGKLRYMALEQLRGEELDHRADQFALGVVAWELLTGRPLFAKAKDAGSLARRIAEEPIEAPSSVSPSVPAALDAVVLRMLARAPEERFPDCAAVGLALEPFVGAAASDARVAAFVAEHASAEPEAGARDEANFLIDLRPGAAMPTSELRRPADRRDRPRARRSNAGWAIAGALALGVGALVASRRAEPGPSPSSANAPSPSPQATPPRPTPTPRPTSSTRPAPRPDAAIAPSVAPDASAPSPPPAPTPSPTPTPEPVAASPVSAATARLVVLCFPRASLEIDGQRRGLTPIEVELPPGEHRLVLENAREGQRRELRVTLARGETKKLEVELVEGLRQRLRDRLERARDR